MLPISVQHISKSYKEVSALADINFEVGTGELFGLIGPDGAGKTTLFRILTTLLLADEGTATVDGFNVVSDYRQIRKRIGYMPGRFSLYQDMTVKENLKFFATVFHTTIEENYDLIRDIYIQIEPFKNRRAGKLSGGMKQKLALCCALIHKPSVLFLDEPTTGVDPVSRQEFWEMLKRLKQQGITILVSTPYMDEASLCDRIALIQQGKILTIDTPKQIIDNYPVKLYAASSDNNYRLLLQLRNNPQVASAYIFGDSIHLTFAGDSNITLPNIREIEPTVEDCFINLLSK
ncbi:ABC transporter ATP-binding protein [Bacteroides sp. OttesenSCG-928-J23]|nr:ABC transporter ATP-binding protein [Bacteroides sp. OttesenSCG-928-N06]MDL2247789.1 ABC transporter ATP-binding protein [Bacteroides sp. OttesenSCG-928-J23]MDL2304218.1 ABC transporter ATP-binding protein [Bacteroides sp. OttesenSCG-928-D19]